MAGFAPSDKVECKGCLWTQIGINKAAITAGLAVRLSGFVMAPESLNLIY
jgi:hypothetical protein